MKLTSRRGNLVDIMIINIQILTIKLEQFHYIVNTTIIPIGKRIQIKLNISDAACVILFTRNRIRDYFFHSMSCCSEDIFLINALVISKRSLLKRLKKRNTVSTMYELRIEFCRTDIFALSFAMINVLSVTISLVVN